MPRKKVLVIEFDGRDAALLAGSLQRHGYVPLTAATGQEGVEKYYNEMPDLVACNLLMPDLPGMELINRLRQRDYRAPIIAINQLAAGGALFVKRLGVEDQIAKPLQEAKFLQLVERLIGPAKPAASEDDEAAKPTAKPADDGVPPRGSLKTLPFHQLLVRLFRQRLSGALAVKDDVLRADLAFRDGLPITVTAEGLIRRLARMGRLDDVQARSARRRATGGVTEEQAIAELKVLPPEQLREAVRDFGYEVLNLLCRPSEARFRWKQGPVEVPPDSRPLDPAVTLKSAAEHIFSSEKITAAFAAKGRIDKPLHLGDDPARLPEAMDNPALQAVLEAARRRVTLSALFGGAAAPRERLDRAAYALAMLRVITFDPQEAWTPPTKPTEAAPRAAAPEPARTAPAAPPHPAPAEPPRPGPAKPPDGKPAPPPPADAEPSDDPLTESQLLQIGIEMLRAKTYSKAQACFADLLERRGEDRQALMLFAKAAFRNRFADPLDRLLDSVDALRRALRIDPRFAEARFTLAQFLAEAGEPELAAAELEALLSFEPTHVEAQRELRNLRRRTPAAE